MNRRSFLLAVPAAALTACAANTTTASQLAADAQTVASGLAAVLPQIAGLIGMPPATLGAVTADIHQAQAAAAALASISAGSAAPITLVQALVQGVNDAVGLLTTAPLSALVPGTIELVLQAAAALLPVIEAAAGLSGATSPPAMSAEAARLILLDVAHR